MKTLEGGCHCGAVRFRVIVEEDQEVIDCNCSICTMKGNLHLLVPETRFAILAGEDALACYMFNTRTAKHLFCRTCGIHAFYRPRSHPGWWDVNARCFDDSGALSRFRVTPFDGKNWEAHVDEIR